jgi:hypothetical protein
LISDRFQGNLYYRRDELIDQKNESDNNLINRTERLQLDFDHEKWRVLQVYLRLENKITRSYHTDSDIKDMNRLNSSHLNLRFEPGIIHDKLTPLHFEFSLNRSLLSRCTLRQDNEPGMWQFFDNDDKTSGTKQKNDTYYIKNELNLASSFLLTSISEWTNQNYYIGASSLRNEQWLWSEKLNYKLNFNTRLNLQYRQFEQDWGYERTEKYYEPSTWIEQRWTEDFKNTYYLLYRVRDEDNGNLHDRIINWEARYDIVWSKYRIPLIRRFEIRQYLIWQFATTKGDNPARYHRYNSNTSIDLYPIHSAIMRFQFDLTRHIDKLAEDGSLWDIGINLKLSFRF